MKIQWLIMAMLCPLLSFSQENSSGPRFHTIASAGMAAGQSAAKPLFQVISGISSKKWFAGIGVGLDYYNLKSIPLFVDGKMNFGKKKTAFLYADGGYSFSFNNKSNTDNFYKTSDRFLGGPYMDAGMGYRVKLKSLRRFSFSAGYSRKNIVNKVVYSYPCITGTSCPPTVYKYNYTMGRIVAKVSWEFGR